MRLRAAGSAAACAIVAALAFAACAAPPPKNAAVASYHLSPAETAFLDTLQRRTFQWFWDLSDSTTGLTPDRWPTKSFVSVGAIGFALTAYPIGVEHGWVSRAAAAQRVRHTLRFLWSARQDTSRAGAAGYRGFYYHFLNPADGTRFKDVELSTMDTALLLAGALFCQGYFDKDVPAESDVRALADSIYRRVDWRWAQVRPPMLALGWDPEHGTLPYDWGGMNEAMLAHLLALGSPTHPAAPGTWRAWTRSYAWGTFYGWRQLGFAPLFGHQYSQVWVDFRGVRDSVMRAQGVDYFENSARATRAQRAYAIANPGGFRDYGAGLWGLSACDGPIDGTFTIDGRQREFHTYWARGASFTETADDGTVAPCAAGGSLAFTPDIALPALMSMRAHYGGRVFGPYGFVDALNPTFRIDTPVPQGQVLRGIGWFDTDYLGIDQGPILAMAENLRSGLIWRIMRRNRYLVHGMKAAGFTGGWLDRAAAE